MYIEFEFVDFCSPSNFLHFVSFFCSFCVDSFWSMHIINQVPYNGTFTLVFQQKLNGQKVSHSLHSSLSVLPCSVCVWLVWMDEMKIESILSITKEKRRKVFILKWLIDIMVKQKRRDGKFQMKFLFQEIVKFNEICINVPKYINNLNRDFQPIFLQIACQPWREAKSFYSVRELKLELLEVGLSILPGLCCLRSSCLTLMYTLFS